MLVKKFCSGLQLMESLTYVGPQMDYRFMFIYHSECTLSFPGKVKFKTSVIAMYMQASGWLMG